MDEAQELIDRIERGEITVGIGLTSYNMTAEQIKCHDLLLELAKLGIQRKWISIEERLPKKDQLVLVANGPWFNLKTFCIDDDGEQGWYDYLLGESYRLDEYSHWMPLPEPPERKDERNEA